MNKVLIRALVTLANALSEEDDDYFRRVALNDPMSDPFDKDYTPRVKELLVSDDFELIFDGNDEFWILNVGYPVWRSQDYFLDETATEWNQYALEKDKITPEQLKYIEEKH